MPKPYAEDVLEAQASAVGKRIQTPRTKGLNIHFHRVRTFGDAKASPGDAPLCTRQTLHQRELQALACLGVLHADRKAIEHTDPHARACPEMLLSKEGALPTKASSNRSLRHNVLINTSLPTA